LCSPISYYFCTYTFEHPPTLHCNISMSSLYGGSESSHFTDWDDCVIVIIIILWVQWDHSWPDLSYSIQYMVTTLCWRRL
jgi:hypothetical protein